MLYDKRNEFLYIMEEARCYGIIVRQLSHGTEKGQQRERKTRDTVQMRTAISGRRFVERPGKWHMLEKKFRKLRGCQFQARIIRTRSTVSIFWSLYLVSYRRRISAGDFAKVSSSAGNKNVILPSKKAFFFSF